MTPDPTTADVETALRQTFAISIPVDRREAIDRHVYASIATRRSPRFRTTRRGMLMGIAAALLLLTATVAAGATLFGSLIRGAPLLEDVWARASVIHQSETDAGYTIVLERAAVDRDRVWVAFTVRADTGARVDFGQMRLTDGNGVVMTGGTGVGSGDTVPRVSADLFGFTVPDGVTPHGPFALEVTSVRTGDREVPGDWSFTFDVPLAHGSVRP
jgi:hypothetical protein